MHVFVLQNHRFSARKPGPGPLPVHRNEASSSSSIGFVMHVFVMQKQCFSAGKPSPGPQPGPNRSKKEWFTNSKQARVCKSSVPSGNLYKPAGKSIIFQAPALANTSKRSKQQQQQHRVCHARVCHAKTMLFCWKTKPQAPTAAQIWVYEQASKQGFVNQAFLQETCINHLEM